jgi:hypothetical protein
VLLEQHPPLAFGHAAPNTKLHLVVERVGEALGDDGTMLANNSRFTLRRSMNEEFVGIGGATPRLRNPTRCGLRPPGIAYQPVPSQQRWHTKPLKVGTPQNMQRGNTFPATVMSPQSQA